MLENTHTTKNTGFMVHFEVFGENRTEFVSLLIAKNEDEAKEIIMACWDITKDHIKNTQPHCFETNIMPPNLSNFDLRCFAYTDKVEKLDNSELLSEMQSVELQRSEALERYDRSALSQTFLEYADKFIIICGCEIMRRKINSFCMENNTETTKAVIFLIDALPDLSESLDFAWQTIMFDDTQAGIANFRSLITELEKTTARIKEIFEETAATKP
jgi:hypothetical protein